MDSARVELQDEGVSKGCTRVDEQLIIDP